MVCRSSGSRSIDVIVSRLRRKAELAGVMLPIRTVYGSGYLFADPVSRHLALHLPPALNSHGLPDARLAAGAVLGQAGISDLCRYAAPFFTSGV